MICIIDAKSHRFSDVNESWLKVFGFERDEGRVSGFVQQSRIPNGQLIDCVISGETLELDGRPHYLFVTEDVFERKRVDRLKNEFIATVSHEIRTPLTLISGSLSFLTGGGGGEIPESAQRLLTIAETNSDRLVRLGNDILDLEKIESGEMMFKNQTVELNTVAERALKINQAYGDQYGVRFKLTYQECGAMVNADRDRLDQVFSNLLSNAAKFSPRDGDVTIFGEIRQNLEVAGGTVRLGGKIGGNAHIAAGRLEILPSAQISGQLSYTSANEVVISPDAVIGGPITRNLSEDHFGHEFHATDTRVGASLVWTIGLTLTGMILFLALPRLMTRVIERFQVTPWKSLGLGFVVLVVTPMLAILSIVLIVGAPLGLLLVAIYPITLLIAYVTAATWLGDTVLGLIGRKNPETWPWRSGALLAALLALSVVGLVPFIGGLTLFLAVVGGLGAWAVVIADHLRTA